MKPWRVWIGIIAVAALCAPSLARAAEITVSMHGERSPVEVECYWVESTDGYGGIWVIEPFQWETSEGSVELGGFLDPDPEINFNVNVLDFGAPSNFSFTFILPLAPIFTNPSIVSDSLNGNVANGSAAGGVTVTALAPPAGIPVDGDLVDELQVFTLSDDGGLTWKNVGLDTGPTTTIPLDAFNAGPYGTFNQGPIPTIAGGPWTHMRADLNFGLSGGGDAFSLSGAKVLVPEPSTLVVALLTLGPMFFVRRRV